MTILEIGISFPTLVDRRSRHYMTVLPSSIIRSIIETQRNDAKSFLPQETNSDIGR
jgi:hypothetical protein